MTVSRAPAPRPAVPPGPRSSGGDAALVLGGLAAAGAVAAHLLVPEDVKQLLELLVWRTNQPAAVTAGLGAVSGAGLLLAGGGRRVRWLTREHQDADRVRRERWRQLPGSVRRRIVAPPLLAFSAGGVPHLALWSLGTTRFDWPAWVGTEVPVERWVALLIEVLGGPIGDGWNLMMPALGWGLVVGLAWRPFRAGWERRVLDGRAFAGRLLPSPGAYQHRFGAVWRQEPVFLLGARENPESRKAEPFCELPSWVHYRGKQIFGGLIVFGQKGSGKTSLLQRIIEDTLKFRPSDPSHKPALMALDPKGDLSSFIVRLAGETGRSDDVVRLAIGGETKWNPFGHLRPDTPARQIRQAGYFLRCAMPRGGGDNAYWEDNATNLLSYAMQLLAYAGEVVSFATLAELVIRLKGSTKGEGSDGDGEDEEEVYRRALYDRARANLSALADAGEVLEELENVRNYFEEEFVFLDPKPRSIVVNTATNFLRKFEGAEYRRTFCASADDPAAFGGFERLVDEGRIFVLDIRAVEDGQVTAALCCLAKLFCQAAILTRDRRTPEMERVVVNVLDEYQQYVTVGGRGNQGDPEYLETSRSFLAVDVAATQQLSSLQDAVGGKDAAQRVAGSFNSLVLFRHNDAALTQYAGHLVGRREQQERSYNVSEGGQDARRLFGEAFAADKQSVTRSVQERTVERDVLTDDLFAQLQTFEAMGIFSTEAGRQVVRFCSKPQWVPARTPQRTILERIEQAEPRPSPWRTALRHLRGEWRRLWEGA